jgi:squalene monooxygenase
MNAILLLVIDASYDAHLTIVADGAASNLRSQLRPGKPVVKSKFWALELLDATLPIRGCAHGVIGDGFPILIYQLDERRTRILMDIPNDTQKTFAKEDGVASYIRAAVIPRLPEGVQAAVDVALRSGKLRNMPNQWLPPKSSAIAGVILLGDAANMRHPLTGGGMTVALKDAITLSRLLRPDAVRLSGTQAVVRAMRAFQQERKSYSMSLNILAQALYTLFITEGMSCLCLFAVARQIKVQH